MVDWYPHTCIVCEEGCLHQAFLACKSEVVTAALNVASRVAICAMDRGLLNATLREMITRDKRLFLFRAEGDLWLEIREVEASEISIICYSYGTMLPSDLSAPSDAGVWTCSHDS
jgi:hypothetical protein